MGGGWSLPFVEASDPLIPGGVSTAEIDPPSASDELITFTGRDGSIRVTSPVELTMVIVPVGLIRVTGAVWFTRTNGSDPPEELKGPVSSLPSRES